MATSPSATRYLLSTNVTDVRAALHYARLNTTQPWQPSSALPPKCGGIPSGKIIGINNRNTCRTREAIASYASNIFLLGFCAAGDLDTVTKTHIERSLRRPMPTPSRHNALILRSWWAVSAAHMSTYDRAQRLAEQRNIRLVLAHARNVGN